MQTASGLRFAFARCRRVACKGTSARFRRDGRGRHNATFELGKRARGRKSWRWSGGMADDEAEAAFPQG